MDVIFSSPLLNALFLIGFVVLDVYMWVENGKRQDLWKRYAYERGFEYKNKGIFSREQLIGIVDGVEIRISTDGGYFRGRYSMNLEGWASVSTAQFPGYSSISCAKRFSRTLLSYLKRRNDVGAEEFDELVRISTDDEGWRRRIEEDVDARDVLVRFFGSHPSAWINSDGVDFQVSRSTKSTQTLDAVIDEAVEVVAVLENVRS